MQKLEDQIFPTITEDFNDDVTAFGTIYTSKANKKDDTNINDRKANNIQRNESLDKYRSVPQSLTIFSYMVI